MDRLPTNESKARVEPEAPTVLERLNNLEESMDSYRRSTVEAVQLLDEAVKKLSERITKLERLLGV